MVKFTNNKLELLAGKVKIVNTSEFEKTITVYVPNKDSVPCTIPVGCTVEVTTVSAGETFMYLNQAQEGLEMTVEPVAAAAAHSDAPVVADSQEEEAHK